MTERPADWDPAAGEGKPDPADGGEQPRDEKGRFSSGGEKPPKFPKPYRNRDIRLMRHVLGNYPLESIRDLAEKETASIVMRTHARRLLGEFEHAGCERVAVAMANADARLSMALALRDDEEKTPASPNVTIRISGGETGPSGEKLTYGMEGSPVDPAVVPDPQDMHGGVTHPTDPAAFLDDDEEDHDGPDDYDDDL